MNYLLIDTCNAHLGVVANGDGKTEYVFEPDCGVNHSVRVMTAVEEVLNRLSLTLDNLDFIGAVVGAGSFTGIRIGVSTVKGLCLAKNLPALKITSFDTIAYNKKGGKVVAVIDAGHGGVYAAAYKDKQLVMPPEYMTVDELKKCTKGFKKLSFGEIPNLKTEIVSPLEGLINYANENGDKAGSLEDLIPVYCRKSQAEEGR
ncbi:MAG: tRNA (adenosine(37)-N6)-threonylcarbamoyltransferase complex dimerization subunit type 1 TsaB [Clostridia bacterium]|nr:tRNA (adenosine(37)-N6)-threonylcarbamoyltransferase complex dimerization subunit type 1 TsaB [Clostridia bacterium]